MISKAHFSILSFALGTMMALSACQTDATDAENTKAPAVQQTESEQVVENPSSSSNQQWVIALDKFRLRDKAGQEGAVLTQLAEGVIVEHMGEVSDFKDRIKLRSILYDEPWIKVKTAAGTEGWAFAGGLLPMQGNQTPLARELMNGRLIQIFGAQLAGRIEAYRQEIEAAKTSDQLALAYRNGLQLCEKLSVVLQDRFEIIDANAPNLFWLEQAIPAYIVQLVAEGTMYQLFNDYKKWQPLAAATEGEEDDAFVQFCQQAHAQDSVENFFYAWFLQTWDYGGSSLLGQGIHLKTLEAMDKAWTAGPQFHPEISKIKQDWMQDITVDVSAEDIGGYWEDKEKIITEMDQILAGNFQVLTKEDRVALEVRRKMFDNPSANKIRINQRSGTQ
ncbi:MAG: SH3 domain-containing protein [Bacteroidota bacterium]